MKLSRYAPFVFALALGAAAHAQPAAVPVPLQSQGEARPTPARALPAITPDTSTPTQIANAIAQLEAITLGACEGNDLRVSRLSGGRLDARIETERQLRASGVTVYRYVYDATGCGRAPRRHNVEVLTHEGLSPMVLTLPMGTTAMSSTLLQGVHQQILTPMMRARYPDCAPARLRILNANVANGRPFVRGQSWSETWRFDACGAQGLADLTFAYDGEGVRMTANVTPAS